MSRVKTVSDEQLLDRLLAALIKHGPSDLSFAKASKEVGLAPATLVQRFGTRSGMMEAALLRAWDKLEHATAEADANAAPDWRGAIDMLLSLTAPETADYDFTDGLLLLREDMRIPALRRRGAAWGERVAGALGRRLSDDESRRKEWGWQMARLWQGTLIWWAFQRDTGLASSVREALEQWHASLAKAQSCPMTHPNENYAV